VIALIHFDRETLSILRYIKRCGKKGASWSNIQKRFGEDVANIFLLEQFNKELYTITQDSSGKWIDFSQQTSVVSGPRSFITPKGNELLEQKCYSFWKWAIPTIISVAALIVSIIALVK